MRGRGSSGRRSCATTNASSASKASTISWVIPLKGSPQSTRKRRGLVTPVYFATRTRATAVAMTLPFATCSYCALSDHTPTVVKWKLHLIWFFTIFW